MAAATVATTELDGSERRSACAQPERSSANFSPPINANAFGSEDCLYLNVYTKRIAVGSQSSNNESNTCITDPEKRLSPVMVYIHGGSSISGWSALPMYDHQKLVANRDVVVVTVNYRLNVFGYLALDVLSSNEEKVTGKRTSGNYGLLDNIAALQWVKDNIAAFRGDSSRVTVYGRSTGGTNVVCLYMSPLARGLFQAALSLSGSPVLKGDLEFASKQNEPFLSLSGCDNKASEAETLDCIYELSPEVISSAI
jgi:carboxylesterase type B